MVAAGKLDPECVAGLKRRLPEAAAIAERYKDPPAGGPPPPG